MKLPIASLTQTFARAVMDAAPGGGGQRGPLRFFLAPQAAAPSARPSGMIVLAILLVWTVVVAAGALQHELWRDEVRALSLALAADHLWNLPTAIQGEGHPILWYLLLRVGHAVTHDTRVLQCLSAAIAFIALAIFLMRAPFPIWWKLLFVLGGLPLYEYAVICRSYGLSMLLMFALAAQLSSPKRSNIVVGALLFLLAQTNVHSALLVPPFVIVWLNIATSERRATATVPAGGGGLVVGLIVAAAGLLCAFLSIYPSRHTLIVSDLRLNAYAGDSYLKGLALAVLEPGHFFRQITALPTLVSTAALWCLVAGLCGRRWFAVAALLGLWANAAVFAMLYTGEFRHQGVWFVFVISLYWIALSGNPKTSAQARPVPAVSTALFRIGLYFVMLVILLVQCAVAYQKISQDLRYERSKSKALAAVIQADLKLHNAIIVAQPDEYLEAMRYYVENPTYLTREQTFGNNATWSLAFKRDVALGDLLVTWRDLKNRTGRPIVVIMSHRWKDDDADFSASEWLGRGFRASAADLRDFRRSAVKLELGSDAYYENFDAYVLR